MEEATGHRRRSARIWELEEKARALSVQKKHTECSSLLQSPPPSAKRKSRKRRSLLDVVINSLAPNIQQEGENPKHDGASTENDQPSNLSSLQQMPNKQTLEFVLDVLQRRDKEEIFAQPVDPDEVAGYYDIIKEPMDFGTMRAKLQEGMYTSLEQFERDVFLISSNAMKFNSSATVYYAEARALSELARRVFRLLKTEPENFKLEYSRTRKRNTRKCQNEARNSRESRDRTNLNPPEAGRRLTYMPRKNESTVSTVYNAPKQLDPVPQADMRYAESLMRFVKDLGPTAQTFALAKIGKLPMKPPISPSCNQASFGNTRDFPVAAPPTGKAMDFPLPASSSLGEFSHPNADNIGHMPRAFLSNATTSRKGKEVCVDTGMDFSNGYKGENIPIHDTYYEARDYPTIGGHKNRTSLEEKDIHTSRKMDASVSSSGKTADDPENMDLLIATVLQVSAFQNRHTLTPSDSHFPLTVDEGLQTGSPSQFTGGSQSWMQNEYPNIQTTNVSSASPVLNSLDGYQSQYPNGEGSSTRAAAVLEHNYSVQQPMKLSHSIPKAVNDLTALQRKFVAQHASPKQQSQIAPSGQNIFLQQQPQISPTGQNTFLQQQPHIYSSGQNTFMQQQSQISSPGQNTFVQQQSQISPTGQNTFMQKRSQIIPTDQNTFMQQKSQISPYGQNAFMQQQSPISPSDQNAFIQQESLISPSCQNAFIQQESLISPSGQNAFLQQESLISPSRQNRFMQNQSLISPSGQNTFMRHQSHISLSDQNTFMRQQSQISSSGQNIFMRQQPQISLSGQNTFMQQQSQISPYSQNTFMQQQSQISPSEQNTFVQQPSQISPSDQNSFLQQPYISRKHDMPFFDALNLLEIAKTPLGIQGEPSTSQCYWDIQGSPLVDTQKPDLALQL